MTITEALNTATAQLLPVSNTPRLDAELLMSHALNMPREEMLMWGLDVHVPDGFAPLINRRLAHEPIAYITGTRAFWSIELNVTPAVLIPRPDSETLIAAAVAYFDSTGPSTILDLGTGSGALLLAALREWPNAHGHGIDRSDAALVIAQSNAERLKLAERTTFARNDWADGVTMRYDLILCNPPYIETSANLARQVTDFEPASSLYGGTDGLDEYKRILPQLPARLAVNGIIALEIGHMQRVAVTALAEAEGFQIKCHQDLGGRDRCLVLRL